MIRGLLAAAAGTAAYSILFGVPGKLCPLCGVVGMVGWGVFLLTQTYASEAAACFAGAVVVVFLSRFFAVRKQCPATLFLIPGIFPLIPGVSIYRASYYLVMDDFEAAAQTGWSAVKNAVAIVLGIVFVFELPQKTFRILQKKTLDRSRFFR